MDVVYIGQPCIRFNGVPFMLPSGVSPYFGDIFIFVLYGV